MSLTISSRSSNTSTTTKPYNVRTTSTASTNTASTSAKFWQRKTDTNIFSFKMKLNSKKSQKQNSKASNLKGFSTSTTTTAMATTTTTDMSTVDHSVGCVDSVDFDEDFEFFDKMALSVPYHPYSCCLICGNNNNSSTSGDAKLVQLQRCSTCKRAPYCSRHCQRLDWRVHRRECNYLKEENELAVALSQVDPTFAKVSDGLSLRKALHDRGQAPILFVLNDLNSLLNSSFPHWDQSNPANGMCINMINLLIQLVTEEANNPLKKINWLRISSNLFGTVMIHRVINEQASEGFKFGQNPWFESYLYNFGEVLDRIKLYAILQENDYEHFLPDSEFPLLRMKEPMTVQGSPHFPEGRLRIEPDASAIKCMICRRSLPPGPVISPHDPDRSAARELPRLLNYLPPRPPPPTSAAFLTITAIEHMEMKLKTWLHIVARTKTIPKEYVCGEECEQHAIYGRLFSSHPLESASASGKQ